MRYTFLTFNETTAIQSLKFVFCNCRKDNIRLLITRIDMEYMIRLCPVNTGR